MERRRFLSTSAAAGVSAASAASASAAAHAETENQIFEIREYKTRNSKALQSKRLQAFFEQEHLPMTKRTGVSAVGYFSVYLGEDTPRYVTVTAYDSMADMGKKLDARAADKAWTKAADEFGSDDLPPFDRVESRLLRAFDGMKKIEVPKPNDAPRFFDLRLYQQETYRDTREKMKMFNTGEIAVFRESGVHPLLFGHTLVGTKMPNLVYMVFYDDEVARAKAWKTFGGHPKWKKIRSTPGWSNDEIVSNIDNTHLKPLSFSPIR